LYHDLPKLYELIPDLADKIKGVIEESGLAEKYKIPVDDKNFGIQSNINVYNSKTQANNKDTIIQVTTITKGYGWSMSSTKDSIVKKSEVKNVKQKIVINKI